MLPYIPIYIYIYNSCRVSSRCMYSSCLVEDHSENCFLTKETPYRDSSKGEVACLFSIQNAISVLRFSCLAKIATHVELCMARQHRDG